MATRRNWIWAPAIGAALVALAGCDQLTHEHYNMITVNVDREMDVAKMIGDPDDKLPGQWHYDRPDKHLHVIIDFSDEGVVVRKQWIDAAGENWEDTREAPGDESDYESTEYRTSYQ